jgi:DNA-binding transcriptional regulator GbsR (MarR family)
MQQTLAISKGSASTGVRQLEQWGAVHKVWVRGDRKDYYKADDWFGRILRNAVVETIGKRMASYTTLLDEVETELAGLSGGNGEGDFIRARIACLRSFQKKAQWVWSKPMIRRLLR